LDSQYILRGPVVSAHINEQDFVSCPSVGSANIVVFSCSGNTLIDRQSGVGKSSLINQVFGISNAVGTRDTTITATDYLLLQSVSHYKPGESDIQQEHVSPENQFFVLHDSKGFEPGDLSNFKVVRAFLEQRSRLGLPLKDRVHGLWCVYFSLDSDPAVASLIVIRLCTETPTAGGRVFETGDEQLLKYAHEIQRASLIFAC